MVTTEDLLDVAEHLEASRSPLMRRWAMRLPLESTKYIRDAEPIEAANPLFLMLPRDITTFHGNTIRYRNNLLSVYIRKSGGNLFVDRQYVRWNELETQEKGDWCLPGDMGSVSDREFMYMLAALLRDEYHRFFASFTSLLAALEDARWYREAETFQLGQRPGYHDVTSYAFLTYPNVEIRFEFANPCGDYWQNPNVYNYQEELPDSYEKFDPGSVDLPYGTAILLRIAQLALKFRGKW